KPAAPLSGILGILFSRKFLSSKGLVREPYLRTFVSFVTDHAFFSLTPSTQPLNYTVGSLGRRSQVFDTPCRGLLYYPLLLSGLVAIARPEVFLLAFHISSRISSSM
ncbi:MAG: hypothetical protein AAFY26_21210, partial [Cyanobacteria bacterium J06638_22]